MTPTDKKIWDRGYQSGRRSKGDSYQEGRKQGYHDAKRDVKAYISRKIVNVDGCAIY